MKFELVPFPRRTGIPGNDIRVLDMADRQRRRSVDRGLSPGTGALDPGGRSALGRLPHRCRRKRYVRRRRSRPAGSGSRPTISCFRFGTAGRSRFSRTRFGVIFIRKLVVGPDGTLFAASGSLGLFRWDGKSWSQYGGESEPGASNVYSVLVDSRGRTLVGTFSGLFRIKRRPFGPAFPKTDLRSGGRST